MHWTLAKTSTVGWSSGKILLACVAWRFWWYSQLSLRRTPLGPALSVRLREVCTATEMIPTIEMISATEMTPNHHRNDPHHRNDTGGHHRNDPRKIGNGIKRITKTGQQLRACFLFIYLYCIFFTVCKLPFYRTLFCSKLFFFFLV